MRAAPCIAAAWLALVLHGCAYYSFTGATIPEHLETVAIPLAEDRTSNPIPDMGGSLTERLVQRFVRQTRLQLATDAREADALVSAEIRGYAIQPSAVGGESRAVLNRLSVTAFVRYVDQKEGREVFQRTFSSLFEYDPSDLSGEEEAAGEVLDDIADDVFQAATSHW